MKHLIAPLAIALLTPASAAHALTFNPGLAPGDTFHLAFLTAGTRDALDPDINNYNAFVQSEAAAAGLDTLFNQPVTWRVIGSTATVDARDNIGDPTSPVFNTNGDLVADNESDLWDGTLDSPIAYTQFGDPLLVFTASGTTTAGTADFPIGSPIFFTVGFAGDTGPDWIDTTEDRTQAPYSFYAISSAITYVPEPASLVLLSFTGLITLRRRTAR